MKSQTVPWIIVVIALVALWINLPSVNLLPNQINLFNSSINLQPLKTSQWEINAFGNKINLSFLTLPNITGRFPIKLGLDLQGGMELVLQTKMEQIDPASKDSALESAREVIERRVNLYGVSEAQVQSSKLGEQRRILVELPGVKDSSAAANLVGKTAQLDFREMPEEDPEATLSGIPAIFRAKKTDLTGADLKKATVTFSSSGKNVGPAVAIEFSDEGARKFAEITKRNIGKQVAIFLDDMPVSAPVVQQEIIGGRAEISGSFTPQEAKDLSIQLNAGALPVPIEVLQQRVIGASLGAESIQKSLIAGAIGILAVVIFMVSYYRINGLVAATALIIYTLITLAIFRTGLFILPPITLTLAGIAGFILSIGMAVDANVLIFERMKEELHSGKSGPNALDAGFKRAWTSIRDSNISSLITAGVLYVLGTSVVKGFALTLAIGVLVSMFSAITVSRTLLRLLPRFKAK